MFSIFCFLPHAGDLWIPALRTGWECALSHQAIRSFHAVYLSVVTIYLFSYINNLKLPWPPNFCRAGRGGRFPILFLRVAICRLYSGCDRAGSTCHGSQERSCDENPL